MTELGRAILRGAIGLSIFAVVTAGLIAITQLGTAERIEIAKKRAKAKALLEIVPATEHDNDLLETSIELPPDPLLGTKEVTKAYIAKFNNAPVVVILPFTSADGYTGNIYAIAGIKPDGSLKGVRITEHKETPGLGDRIEQRKSSWVLGFNDKSLKNPDEDDWKVNKDGGTFDQLTGATITSRAVVGGVKKALQYFHIHRQRLLYSEVANTEAKPLYDQP